MLDTIDLTRLVLQGIGEKDTKFKSTYRLTFYFTSVTLHRLREVFNSAVTLVGWFRVRFTCCL